MNVQLYIIRKKKYMFFKNVDKIKILVIGDIMIDKNVFGEATKISPEAPVVVVNKSRTEYLLGGASNVANNISSLGAKVDVIAMTGDDFNSDIIKRLLEEKEIHGKIIYDASRPTIVKERIFARNQQLIRIDDESDEPISEDIKERIRSAIKSIVLDYDVIIISDYEKGVIYDGIISDIQEITSKPVFVDPKPKNAKCYHNAFLIKPNKLEMELMSGITINSKSALIYAANEMIKKYDCKYLLVTLSGDGMALFGEEFPEGYFIETDAKEIVDVTGAGDTVISTMAVCYALGYDIINSCMIANKAAGIVVSKLGTVPICLHELS